MRITKLFNTQANAVPNVIVDKSLNEYKIFARKHVQLHIIMSDLANETKCSTYWLDSQIEIDKDTTFNKYIACLSQIISLALDNNHSDMDDITISDSEYCLSDQFLNLFIDINDLIMSPSKDHFVTILEDFLTLGKSLGFSEEMIINGFCESKNKMTVAL